MNTFLFLGFVFLWSRPQVNSQVSSFLLGSSVVFVVVVAVGVVAIIVVVVLIIAINFGMSGVVNEFLGHFLARHAML